MGELLTAKHQRADGTPVVRVEVAHYFTHEEAAEALALVNAGEPPSATGIFALRSGLTHAARYGTSGTPDLALVASYREALDQPAIRHRFFKTAMDDHGKPRSARWLGLSPHQATHARAEVAHFFDIDEAADSLAEVYTEIPRRTGRTTCSRGLHDAAVARVWEHPQRRGDYQERVRFFRDLLTSVEPPIF